jgi:hypothetical protein
MEIMERRRLIRKSEELGAMAHMLLDEGFDIYFPDEDIDVGYPYFKVTDGHRQATVGYMGEMWYIHIALDPELGMGTAGIKVEEYSNSIPFDMETIDKHMYKMPPFYVTENLVHLNKLKNDA